MPARALALLTSLIVAAPAAAAQPPQPPMELPSASQAHAGATASATTTWILGATPTRAAQRLATRAGAHTITPGTYLVAAVKARVLAKHLKARHLLVWAEPNRTRGRLRQQTAPTPDPLSPQAAWRDVVVEQGLIPPPVTPQSPLLALVDSPADLTHPEFQGGAATTLGGFPISDLHGTATLSAAAAPDNDVGILGIWPGMAALNVPLPPEPFSCGDSAAAIARAIAARPAVINMSYGSASLCYAEYAQLQLATGRGITLVAAAGNEFDQGNPLEYPGSLPHVLTVAAVAPNGKAAFFSNANAAIDLAAPGESVLLAVPPAFQDDGKQDGYEALNGTSFSAPMVAAAAAWVRAARPELKPDQVAQVVRLSAHDLGAKGWDASTGFGLLDVGAALKRAAPRHDPSEPNDDVLWIDGRAFKRPDPFLSAHGHTAKLRALLDEYEDPADVYRVSVPPHARMRIVAKPGFGDVELGAFARSATSIDDGKALIAKSEHRGSAQEGVTVRSISNHAQTVYAAVAINPAAKGLDASYTLTIRRLRTRS